MKQLPTNLVAENGALSCAMTMPDTILPIYQRLGLTAEQFSGVQQKRLYAAMLALREDGKTIDQVMLSGLLTGMADLNKQLLDSPSQDTPTAAVDYALTVIEAALSRDVIEASRFAAMPLYGMKKPVVDVARELRDRMDEVLITHGRTTTKPMTNPADDLAEEDGWSVQIGIPWFDERIRLVSGRCHGLAGDPNTGKSLIAYQTVGFNACAGIPTAIFVAEDKELDIKTTLLAQLQGRIDMVFVNRIRYDPSFKTESNLAIVREMWDEHYGNVHFIAASVTGGPEAVLNAIEALPGPHFVVVDHAYAVVGQARKQSDQMYRDYILFYSGLEMVTERCNHITLILNQYKVSERGSKNPDRGEDAQFGGSIVQNILFTMVHMWKPSGEDTETPSGWQAVYIECVKAKARMVVNEAGEVKDPLDGPGVIRIHLKYRVIGEPKDFPDINL